ncbi:MAG TPA: sialate O-acetylesterase, partial [Segetibacter sp.]
MILQRGAKVKIWGWAATGEKVRVSISGKNYKTITGTDGKWFITLLPMKAGGPYTMNIDATNHITLKGILFGDVFFCSGQSNMEH